MGTGQDALDHPGQLGCPLSGWVHPSQLGGHPSGGSDLDERSDLPAGGSGLPGNLLGAVLGAWGLWAGGVSEEVGLAAVT